MKVLIIDTAHHPARLWVIDGMDIIAHQEWENGPKTGISLLEALESSLAEVEWKLPEIDRIGVHAGPGGYSSLRAGAVSGQMLGVASGVPVVPVSGGDVKAMTAELVAGGPVEVVEMRYK